jgi:4-alpha-glucanotransferase
VPDNIELLRHLAAALRIEIGYRDIKGRFHEASPETLKALLDAFDVATDNQDAMRASLLALDESEWRCVPAACVTWEDEIIVPVNLSVSQEARGIQWRVALENGTVRSGEIAPDALNAWERKVIGGEPITRYRFALPGLPLGYHRLFIETGKISAETALIVAPRRCYVHPQLLEKKSWGISLQLYGVRSQRNWGVGDFTDLRETVRWATKRGANVIGLNPLHATFSAAPEIYNPYASNSRLFLNPLYLDVAAITDLHNTWNDEGSETKLIAACDPLRDCNLVDYATASGTKQEVLQRAFAYFRTAIRENPHQPRASEFRRFCAEKGTSLRNFGLFESLAEVQGSYDWKSWPASLRDPASPAVEAFARTHGDRVMYFQYLQWQAHYQLAAASAHARDEGMAIGLFGDLALGSDPDGFDVWNHQKIFAHKIHIGVPPDQFNKRGQEWGIAPLDPRALRVTGYEYFSTLLSANMQHFGALRVDHIMGIQRLFLIPAGAPPEEGTYLQYPREELLAILALESHRHRCTIIGEDLGTVPDDFRPRMSDANVLSYRVLYFERNNGSFRRPRDYSTLSLACVTTHDLPTLHGFWHLDDLELQFELGSLTEEEFRDARTTRARDKELLLQALADEDLIAAEVVSSETIEKPLTAELATAIHLYLARSTSMLFMAQMEDLIGEKNQANLPGTTHQYPNWRRKLSKTLEQISRSPAVDSTCAVLARERPRR